MTEKKYQICSNCIMDTSDPTLKFDESGVCSYCINFKNEIEPNWFPNDEGIKRITPTIQRIKKEGKNKDHDCIIGLSGGMDSTYLVHVAVTKFNLRPLIFHCDAGWNSDISTNNIQKIVDALNLDLVTHVINWEEMKDLQRAFFKSQVPFVDQPQDMALFSALYNFSAENGFKWIITGGNNSTECVRECIDWTYFSTDVRHVKDIHKKFGDRELKTFPMCDLFKYKIYYRYFKGMRVLKLLDSYPYIKKEAIDELVKTYDWKPYKMKHYESRFTRFFESFWTPKKHGYDKRRAYLSSEILTGQITRDYALERISKPELSEEEMAKDFSYVAKKLDWTDDELWDIFHGKNKSFKDYKNNFWLIKIGMRIMNLLGFERRLMK